MYTLYYLPNACSLATHTLLLELNQPVRLVHRDDAQNFKSLNPVGSVPVLHTDDALLTEGAAINLYLLQTHPNALWPTHAKQQQQTIQDIMFANATMHPAYSRLFFIRANISEESIQTQLLERAAESINALWAVVDARLETQSFLGGTQYSAADIMLAVYARWGAYFPVNIVLGEKSRRMVTAIENSTKFQQALAEQATHLAQRAAA